MKTIKAGENKPRVYDYLNYREYLADHFAYCQQRVPSYSFRQFARRADLGSPNYLKLVIEGRRNLSEKMAARFGETCGLKGDSLRYFGILVRFNQARTTEAKSELRSEMLSFTRFRNVHQLARDQLEYFSKWFIPAVRELMSCYDFREDPEWIARRLRPNITASKVAKTIEVLLNLGLVRRKGNRLVASDPLVSSGLETPSDLMANYHREMMRMASESIDTVPREQRDISSLTIAVGPTGLEELKRVVQRFRREILELSSRQPDPGQVVQLNIQLFPLSSNPGAPDAE